MAVKIVLPGAVMTVQDGGRYGYQEAGVQVSGAMDQMAFRNANYLVGNEETEAVLEVTLFGGTLEFTEDTITAITGADMEPVVDGDPVEMNCPLLIRKGQILTLGMTRQGCRTYLAFAGGIDVPLVMGSRSTNLKCAFGGYGGRALKAGDVLKLGKPKLSFDRVKKRRTKGIETEKIIEVRAVPGPQQEYFTEAGEKVLITAEHEVGIKGINIAIECSARNIKVKGSREYKYPILEQSVDDFQDEMLDKYPEYSIYVSGQTLSFSKVFTYQDEKYAVEKIKGDIDIMEDVVLTFENDCVNFMEKEVNGTNSNEEYNPEDNINIVNVDNSFHAVSTTEQDNNEYEERHGDYTKETFKKLISKFNADVNGNEMTASLQDNKTVRCVMFPMDSEILVSASVPASRDTGAMYVSYITSNYPELMSSYDSDNETFTVRTYSSPDEYEPDGTENLLNLCMTALDACINEYKQTLEKKDSSDFASDVQQILAEQTETIWEREKAVAAREEEMAKREEEMTKKEEELTQKVKELEEEKERVQAEAEKERQKMKDHEAERKNQSV